MILKIKNDFYYKLIFRFIIIIILTYGFLYSAYKLWTPEITGGSDFYEYYKMFQNPIYNNAMSPFIYRQFTAWTVYFIGKLNLNYDTLISFNNSAINQSTFFSIIISNYLGLVFTSLSITYAVDFLLSKKSILLPLIGGLLVFFSFNTIPHNISGIFEAWSWFFYALIILLYLKKSNWIYLFIVLGIFQREIIPIVFGIFSFFDYFFDLKKKSKKIDITNFYFKVLITSILSFVLYILIRTQFFPVPGNENQLQIKIILTNIVNFRISLSWFVPVILSQNIYAIYLISLLSIRFKYEFFKQLITIFAVFFTLIIIGISTGLGSNLGRILSQVNPILIVLIFKNFNWSYLKSKELVLDNETQT